MWQRVKKYLEMFSKFGKSFKHISLYKVQGEIEHEDLATFSKGACEMRWGNNNSYVSHA